MKTAIILLAIALLIAAPIPACQAAQPMHGIVTTTNNGLGMGCPGCPGCPDNPSRNPNEPACY